jgi:hypothetical protein
MADLLSTWWEVFAFKEDFVPRVIPEQSLHSIHESANSAFYTSEASFDLRFGFYWPKVTYSTSNRQSALKTNIGV